MTMQGEAVRPGRRDRRLIRSNIFGYLGRPGPGAAETFRKAQNELVLDPLQGAPAETSTGDAVFAFCRTDARAVSQAIAPDGSFVALIGSAYDMANAQELLDLWLAEGIAAFNSLNFCGFLVAWNAGSAELSLVRDRFGAEVGYYAKTEDGLLFADDQETLVRMGVDPTIDEAAIDAFLVADYFPAPLTPYKAIRKVPPGSYLRLSGGDMTVSSWAKYLPVEPVPYDEAIERIGPVIEASLARMWPEQGDVGLLLSGGIDSAMVAVGITRMLGQPLRAFTFRYEGYEGHLNESGAARVVADHLGIPHQDIPVRPLQMMDDLDASVANYGEPFNWGLHSYRMGPIAQEGIRTVFSGSGADGTDVAKRHAAIYRFNALPDTVRRIVRTAVQAARPLRLTRQQKAEWVTRRTEGLGDLFSPDSELRRTGRSALYRDRELAESGSQVLNSIYDAGAKELPGDGPLSMAVMDKRFTAAETGGAWNRAFTRGNGLEGRFPFLDTSFFALGLGTIDGNGKDLIRQLALQYLPESVANAPKQPQEMPVDHWIRGQLANPVRERLSEMPSAMTEIFDPAGVRSMVDRHIAGSDERGWEIISLLTLESWFRQRSG